MATTSASGSANIKANATAAQQTALGQTSGCPFCDRKGLPILPLRYAILPVFLRKRGCINPMGQKQLGSRLQTSRTEKALEDKEKPQASKIVMSYHNYAIRTLRKGYLHVYLNKPGFWQIYAITKDGLLRLLKNPDDPDAKTDRDMGKNCRAKGDNIPASFLSIPKEYAAGTVYVALGENIWEKDVREGYEKDPSRRMQKIDCKAFASAPDSQTDGFEINATGNNLATHVFEYVDNAADSISRVAYSVRETSQVMLGAASKKIETLGWQGAHGHHFRINQATNVAQKGAAMLESAPPGSKLGAFVLDDPIGMVEEANFQRLQVFEWKKAYCGDRGVSRRHVVSQSILALRQIVRQDAMVKGLSKAGVAVVKENDEETKKKFPGKKLVLAESMQTVNGPNYVAGTNKSFYDNQYYSQYNTASAKGEDTTTQKICLENDVETVSKKTYWEESTWNNNRTVTTTKLNAYAEAEKESNKTLSGWEDNYSENARQNFEKQYTYHLKKFQEELNISGEDYTFHSGHKNFHNVLFDYASKPDTLAVESMAACVDTGAACLAGGPTCEKTEKLWRYWLTLNPDDAENPVYKSLFGQRSFIKYLIPDEISMSSEEKKADKLYDIFKGLATSEQGEHFRESAVKPIKAGSIAAIMMALNVAYGFMQFGQKVANSAATKATNILQRAQQAVLSFYANLDPICVDIKVSARDFLKAMAEVGIEITKETGKIAIEGTKAVIGGASAAIQNVAGGIEKSADAIGSAGKETARSVRSMLMGCARDIDNKSTREAVLVITLWSFKRLNEFGNYFETLAKESKAAQTEIRNKLGAAAKEVENSLGSVSASKLVLSSVLYKAIKNICKGVVLTSTALIKLIKWFMKSIGTASSIMASAAGAAADLLKSGAKWAAQKFAKAGSQIASQSRKIFSPIANLEVIFGAGALFCQSWAYKEATRALAEGVGHSYYEASAALLNAQMGVAGAIFEIVGNITIKIFGGVGNGAIAGLAAIAVAGIAACIASIADFMQAVSLFFDAKNKGDTLAKYFYFASAAAFFGAAVASGIMAYGAIVAVSEAVETGVIATAAAPLSLTGPLGWFLLAVALGVTFLFFGSISSKTALDHWFRRCVFGYGDKEGSRSNITWGDSDTLEEIGGLNAVIFGASVEIGFDAAWHEFHSSASKVGIRVFLPNFESTRSKYLLTVSAVGQWMAPVANPLKKGSASGSSSSSVISHPSSSVGGASSSASGSSSSVSRHKTSEQRYVTESYTFGWPMEESSDTNHNGENNAVKEGKLTAESAGKSESDRENVGMVKHDAGKDNRAGFLENESAREIKNERGNRSIKIDFDLAEIGRYKKVEMCLEYWPNREEESDVLYLRGLDVA